mgnify:FL=1
MEGISPDLETFFRVSLLGDQRFEYVADMLSERLSPEQIAGKLRNMNIPSLRDVYACSRTIYSEICTLPDGELRKELVICLRQGNDSRRPRSGGVGWCDQILEMVRSLRQDDSDSHGYALWCSVFNSITVLRLVSATAQFTTTDNIYEYHLRNTLSQIQ